MSNDESGTPGAADGAGSSTIPIFPVGTINRRPDNVTSLMCERDIDGAWFTHALRQNRFFIVNLGIVLSKIGFSGHTLAGPIFKKAEAIIADETKWSEQFPFGYACHPRHLAIKKRSQAKFFGHAATIIVAMEVAASDLKNPFNVYDFLRILPAQYFVDQFDAHRKAELIASYDAMSPADKVAKFGEEKAGHSFDRLCLSAIEQASSDGLLDEIADGYCITKYTAELLEKFVNENFDRSLRVGPVMSSGADSESRGLGYKSACKALRVPKKLMAIPPCP